MSSGPSSNPTNTSNPFAGVYSGLPAPTFAVRDVPTIVQSIIAGFQAAWKAATGQTIALAPADPRTLFLLNIADVVSAQRSLIQAAGNLEFLPTSSGAALDMIGTLYGPAGLRTTASPASTVIQFTLASIAAVNVPIPTGTQVAAGNLVFATTADVTIPVGQLSVSANANCLTVGTIGNGYQPGQIANLLNWTSAYVISAVNTAPSQDGANAESDAAYAQRLYLVPAALSKSGPKAAYEELAFSANPAITDVSVCSWEDGFPAGTVNIFAVGAAGSILAPGVYTEILNACSDDTQRPVADYVFAGPPSGVPATFNVGFYVDQQNSPNLINIISNIQTAGAQYISELTSVIGRSINRSQGESRLLAAGASRCTGWPKEQVLQPWQIAVVPSGGAIFSFISLESDNWVGAP